MSGPRVEPDLQPVEPGVGVEPAPDDAIVLDFPPDAPTGRSSYDPVLAAAFERVRPELQKLYGVHVELFQGNSPEGLGRLISEAFTAIRARDPNANRLVVLTTLSVLPTAMTRQTLPYDLEEMVGSDNPRAVVEVELPHELRGLRYNAKPTKHYGTLGHQFGILEIEIPRRDSGEIQRPVGTYQA